MIFAIDFDGTVVNHEYPDVGPVVPYALETLRLIHLKKHRIILHTMRSGVALDAAIRWYDQIGVPLYAVNRNPEQATWTSSPKIHADYYIDDRCFGIPLTKGDNDKSVVDWEYIYHFFIRTKFLDRKH